MMRSDTYCVLALKTTNRDYLFSPDVLRSRVNSVLARNSKQARPLRGVPSCFQILCPPHTTTCNRLFAVFCRVLFMQAFVTRGIGKCCGALWIGASNSRSEQVRAVQSDRALVRCGSPSTRCREARRSPAAHSRESPRRPFCNSSGRGVIA